MSVYQRLSSTIRDSIHPKHKTSWCKTNQNDGHLTKGVRLEVIVTIVWVSQNDEDYLEDHPS